MNPPIIDEAIFMLEEFKVSPHKLAGNVAPIFLVGVSFDGKLAGKLDDKSKKESSTELAR